jgi:hypothetical protein
MRIRSAGTAFFAVALIGLFLSCGQGGLDPDQACASLGICPPSGGGGTPDNPGTIEVTTPGVTAWSLGTDQEGANVSLDAIRNGFLAVVNIPTLPISKTPNSLMPNQVQKYACQVSQDVVDSGGGVVTGFAVLQGCSPPALSGWVAVAMFAEITGKTNIGEDPANGLPSGPFTKLIAKTTLPRERGETYCVESASWATWGTTTAGRNSPPGSRRCKRIK